VYLEIKAKPHDKTNKYDMAQIYTYWFITQKPVLLVNYVKGRLSERLFGDKELKMGWESLEEQLIFKSKRLSDLLNIVSYRDYVNLKDKMKHPVVRF
jgi:hypothetical protein